MKGASEVRGFKLLRSNLDITSYAAAGNVISVRDLIILKQRAMRRGLWYKAVNRLDRLLVDLTIKVSSVVHSITLARSLLLVAQKLQHTFESKLEHATRTIGVSLAQKNSLLAQTWHYKEAAVWAIDQSFARYLAIMNLDRLLCRF